MRSKWINRVAFSCVCFLMVCLFGCGNLPPQLIAFNDNTTEEDTCLDIWTLVHTGAGYYLGYRLEDEDLPSIISMLTLYEVTEPHFWPDFNESGLNQRCDIVVGTVGWIIESRGDD